MKFKVGDRVKNIINNMEGIITVISKTEDIDEFNGQFKQPYYVSYNNCTGNWHTMVEIEKVEEILDEKEKEYLSNFIKPFKNSIIDISKNTDISGDRTYEFISIRYVDKPFATRRYMQLPSFKGKTMYKNMQINKGYTLKELNLD